MAKTLQQKQRQLEDDHFAEVVQDRLDEQDQQFVLRAWDARAALRVVGSLSNFLMSQHIRGLMLVEEEKLWRGLGYGSFADFLTNDPAVIPSKTGYYDQRDVLLNSSDEVLDAITGKVSPRKVKALLSAGLELSIENGHLKIGEEAIAVSNTRAISAVIEGVHQSLRDRDAREEKLTRDLEKEKEKNRIGTEENKALQRQLADDAPRIQKALMLCLHGLFNFVEAVGELDDAEKAARGTDDLKLIAAQYFRLADSYGVSQPLARPDDSDDLFDQIDTDGLD